MSTQLRDLIASTLHDVKAHTLPSVCERFGLEPGTGEEAFASKRTYVLQRLERVSDEKVLAIAQAVVKAYPNDALQAAIESLEQNHRIISDITRHNLAEALNGVSLNGKRDLLGLLRKHFPQIDRERSLDSDNWEASLSDPEGAITAAKSLLETVCKHIIEEMGGSYEDNDDLPKLNALASERLIAFMLMVRREENLSAKPTSGNQSQPNYKARS